MLLDEVGKVRSLLLCISGRLAEPDAAEGVQAGTGLEGRARASAARESPDWRQAVASHDSLVLRTQGLQTAMVAAGGGGGGGSAAIGGRQWMNGGGSGSFVSAGPALALQRLDLGHVLGTYLSGLQVCMDGDVCLLPMYMGH